MRFIQPKLNLIVVLCVVCCPAARLVRSIDVPRFQVPDQFIQFIRNSKIRFKAS